MCFSKSFRLANGLANSVDSRVATFAKVVIKYQGKHLPRNTFTFLQASATKIL